jgi:glycerophosphoryl diester phosphodiesterase
VRSDRTDAAQLLIDPDAHPVIAHRGASGYAPENTLPSFERAAELGADALEMDVHVTADGVPVVIHDATLERTTDMAGLVAALPLARLREADAGARFSPDGGRTFPFRGRGVRIPTFAEVVDAFPDLPLVIEVKTPRAQEAAKRVLAERAAAARCVITSASSAALAAFREPPWICGAATPQVAQLRFPIVPRSRGAPVPYRALFVPLRYYGLTVPTPRFIRAARQLGCPVHIWTVNDPANARALWARGIAGVVTNYPDVMLAERARTYV